MSARDELRGTLSNTICNASHYPKRAQPYLLGGDMSDVLDKTSDALLAAGYRKAEQVTEFGTIFNRSAVFLNPPAESVEEFKNRYESECGWMLTERDPILTRTFLRCDPEPSEPVLHEGGSK